MSDVATLARPYAEAVFKRAIESNSASKWSEMLALMSAVMENTKMVAIVDNPKISKDRMIQLLLDICQGHINAEGTNFIKLLVDNNRFKFVTYISRLFEVYKAEHEGYVDVEVKAAYKLIKSQQQALTAVLEKTLNKKVHISIGVDKSLIGGILIRAGDRVIDGSIKGQLQKLAKSL